MNINILVFLAAILVLLYLDLVLIIKILMDRERNLSRRGRILEQQSGIINILIGLVNPGRSRRQPRDLTESYRQMKQVIVLEADKKQEIEASVRIAELQKRYTRRLRSVFSMRRMEAAVQLGFVGNDAARLTLERALVTERSFPVKLYIANAIADLGDARSIPSLIASLINAHRWYRIRVNALLTDYGIAMQAYLPQLLDRPEAEIKELLLDLAAVHYSSPLKKYLHQLLRDRNVNRNRPLYAKMDQKKRCCGNCIWSRKIVAPLVPVEPSAVSSLADAALQNAGSPDAGSPAGSAPAQGAVAGAPTAGGLRPDDLRQCRFHGPVRPLDRCFRFKRLPVSIEGSLQRQNLIYRAAETIALWHPDEIANERYLQDEDPVIRNIAVRALVRFNTRENMERLLSLLADESVARTAVDVISQVTSRTPRLLSLVEAAFFRERKLAIRKLLAEILSRKIEFYMMKLVHGTDNLEVAEIIRHVLLTGKTSGVIDFLNKNRNPQLEDRLVSILAAIIPDQPEAVADLQSYLQPRLLARLQLAPAPPPARMRPATRDRNLIRGVWLITVSVILLFPVIYVARHFNVIGLLPWLTQLKLYVVDFNYYLIFYSLAVNLIYMTLLFLSLYNLRRQSRLWKLKSRPFLFKHRMLPSISILAPAFNEEKNIIESARSLLNLQYPDYELVIINDGSRDRTLEVLIEAFQLTRIDHVPAGRLKTQPVRGVYRNESLPRLTVVDKINGGKADALNVGINLASKEFFCGIDADSLLESDALLKLASLELDAGVEMPALGGNVFPANGCEIDKGQIRVVRIPRNWLARLQTIEYIRAFMSGRLGWSLINSMLIISGAFGLFRRERVIAVGGYLTSSGPYEKDTVGEDMELVVRITRLMREQKLHFKIAYAFNANCWTEVPEDLNSLSRQRYRWQRGLADILIFHRKMLLNPAYGRTGLVAMPYFLLFELIGPFIEVQGYLMVVLAAILGLLNGEVALLLFLATVAMGTLISLFSLMIGERESPYFQTRDTWQLIWFALLENFGPRQLMSFWRLFGSLRIITRNEGWGNIRRQGFSRRQVPGTGSGNS